MSPPMQTVYAMQDGADFYLFDGADISYPSEREPFVTISAPFKVLDFDVPAAERAREWFLSTKPENWLVLWPDPYECSGRPYLHFARMEAA